ncbi:XylR family transcriptional regulator [Duganella sp. Dugasp56]|uniref:XylR family transcriptional regulator n=1 Tax=Duganella sp. Dugasp56 TaxID=3243046 RepID=UPI0039B0C44A
MKAPRIALLFNANKAFDRDVVAGIASYLRDADVAWDLFLEEDFRLRLAGFEHWQGDGIIADFDDPAVAAVLSRSSVPVVAVGGSYASEAEYPCDVPYVATDNAAIVKLAHQHLAEAGLRRFAMFSQPATGEHRWALERENAFHDLMERDRMEVEIFRGGDTSVAAWNESVRSLICWLHSLPKPIGIIAVTDARARQLLQACAIAGIAVPEQVALVGIDNDPLVRALGRIPLSSVIQGGEQIGAAAARLMDGMLHGVPPAELRLLVPPAGVNAQASSRHQAVNHPQVVLACHFIRQYACQGIRGQQVAAYVGVSRSSLETYFRQELGCSVHDAILRFKLEAAKMGLESGGASMADVAQGCGFSSAQYMHLVFKRELGGTPRAYRSRALGEAEAA